MSKKLIAFITVVVLLIIAVPAIALVVFSSPDKSATASNTQNSGSKTSPSTAPDAAEKNETSTTAPADDTNCPTIAAPTISVSSDGFTPSCITIASGTKISWVNKGSDEVQLGIDPHPSHTGNKEITNGDFVLELGAGQTKTSTITSVGTFKYHDHLNPSAKGQVIVK